MKKNALLTFSITVFAFAASAQTSCGIYKARAFYTVNMPGMAMTDANGNIIQPIPFIDRFIYLEFSGNKAPVIESVMYINVPMKVTLSKIAGNNTFAGNLIDNNEALQIKAEKLNSLWKIALQLPDDKNYIKGNCKLIVIKTRAAGKTCSYKISNETELASMPRY